MNVGSDRKATNSSRDSSIYNSWIANEDGTLLDVEDITEIVMKIVTLIDNDEEYAKFSDLSNNLSFINLRNSKGVKTCIITKDHTYMLCDFIQDRKHF